MQFHHIKGADDIEPKMVDEQEVIVVLIGSAFQ